MSSEPEEDFLDSELRNVFQDYNLPPAEHMHVWAGVAERIGSLPAPRTGLPYRLVLPLATAAIGVAVGWLLPRPDAQPVLPQARPVVFSTTSLPTAPAAQPAVALAPLSGAATELAPAETAIAAPTKAVPAQPRWVKRHSAANRHALVQSATQPAASQPATTTAAISDSTATMAVLAPTSVAASEVVGLPIVPTAGTDSVPAAPKAPALAPAPSASHALPVAERPVKSLKPEGTNEKITYHKPTHRQTEQRGGIRRWFSRVGQSVRHAVGL